MRAAWGIALTLATGTVEAQVAPRFVVPTTNPPAVVKERISATNVEIEYHRPSVKGRRIFGGLVPYGQVWRTGSDNATRITFGTPVTFGTTPVAAGRYELFSIPGEAEWTVILAADREQWGSYSYDKTHDVARAVVRPAVLSEPVETFALGLEGIRPGSATLSIRWDRVRVDVPITVDVRATALPKVEEALRAEGRKPYFAAAMFYFENDLDIDRAAELIGLAVAEMPTHIGILHRQALILERKGDYAGARAAAEASLAGAQRAGRELKEEYTRLNTAVLARLQKR